MSDRQKIAPPLWRRAVTLMGTLAVLGVAVAAVVGGRGIIADRAAAVPAPIPAPPTPVATAVVQMQDSYVVQRRFSGQVEARQSVNLAFEQAGTVARIAVREGATIAQGDVLAELDTRLLRAERARLTAQRRAMEAQAEQARRTNARQVELQDRGFASDQAVDTSSLTLAQLEASIAEIDAARTAVDINLDKAQLVAPFAGTIGARRLDTGAVVAPGAAVVTLVEAGTPRFRTGLDPDMAASLTLGDRVAVLFGDTVRQGRVAQLSPDLDPTTRTRTVFVDLPGPALPDGKTGELRLDRTVSGIGAWVPLSALRQGPRGTWTILVIEDGVVGVEAAELVHLDAGRAFVRGTFTDGAVYVPDGTHRLVPGQPVVDLSDQEQVAWAR
ncbi:MAG: efflux RND transporter periplasmic adaptor subunit [Pseudomonadota bacterium]